MRTDELIGAALDYAVAKAWHPTYSEDALISAVRTKFSPSTDWTQGGAIIEQEKMGVWFCDSVIDAETDEVIRELTWYAEDENGDHVQTGSTPLVAAMRCYVASKLGDEVEVDLSRGR